MPTKDDLKMMQALPLSLKVRMTQQRIRDWVREFGEDGVYISFSGGKDSTVLLHLVRDLYPGIPAVFVNTGLEYPEIQRFVREFENVEILYPKMPFPEVISKYGYPFENQWVLHGCNAFDSKRPTSNPMAFWVENDVLEFVKAEGIKIAPVYGDIVVQGDDGFEYDTMIGGACKYRTTGCDRTGCIFCGFGAHLEKGLGRFERLKRTHPKQYDYCMGGGAYGEDGIWRPSKEGLGMAHVIDELCRLYGPGFIRY